MKAMKHRGPDGQNYMELDEIALGFVRLSFVDLQGGMQPIQNEDRTVTMVCNGEIFNYQSLREKLCGGGAIPFGQTRM